MELEGLPVKVSYPNDVIVISYITFLQFSLKFLLPHNFNFLADDDDIASFLNDEIAAEKGNLKRAEIPKGNFEVKTDGAEVTFTKTSGNEK